MTYLLYLAWTLNGFVAVRTRSKACPRSTSPTHTLVRARPSARTVIIVRALSSARTDIRHVDLLLRLYKKSEVRRLGVGCCEMACRHSHVARLVHAWCLGALLSSTATSTLSTRCATGAGIPTGNRALHGRTARAQSLPVLLCVPARPRQLLSCLVPPLLLLL